MAKTWAAPYLRLVPRASLAALALTGVLSGRAWAEARPPFRPDPAKGSLDTGEIQEDNRLRGATPGAGEFDAELIQRARGEWVIVSLAPSIAASDAVRLDPRVPAPSPSDEQGVAESLRAYEQALEGRDLEQLARVWIMNPTEREELRRFFGRAGSVRVSIDPTRLVVDGNRAVVRFAQQLVASARPAPGRALRSFERALAARDAYATWSLDRLAHPD